jgi:hypothetical protein
MAVTRSTDTLSNVPSWLYELLPFIYIAGGLLVIIKLGGGIAIISSALLIFAGVRVLSMRRKHRTVTAKPKRAQVLSRR